MIYTKTAATFLLIILAVYANEKAPEVKVKQGRLKGKTLKNKNGKVFQAFTGIPYAKPPVGALRFKPPIPADPWNGTFDATRSHAICMQSQVFAVPNGSVVGEEDCLYLNVYTPKLPDGNADLLPVLFYIHGGAFLSGTGQFHGPDLLINKDVVLVTINYRLGPFGFLTSGTLDAIGNDGLKDQNLALRWTRKNIAKFGGNPKGITVFGQSAGGASAHFHMISPLSKGLITGVIAQSGTALSTWALMPHFLSTRKSKILAGNLGCNTYYVDQMMECLRKVDAHKIIQKTAVFNEWDIDPLITFKPVIEPNVKGAFLAEDPIDIIISGKAANVPLMTGVTTDEGYLRAYSSSFEDRKLVEEFDKDFKTLAPLVLMINEGIAPKHKDKAIAAIRKFYFGDDAIDSSSKAKFSEMVGDAVIYAGVDAAVELHKKFSKQPIYYYLFGYKGSTSFCAQFANSSSTDHGVCHSDDLLYLFNNDGLLPKYEPSESDLKITQLMTSLWANFAKYGNPTPENDSSISVKWLPIELDRQHYYSIRSPSDVNLLEDLYKERVDFWRNLKLNVRTEKIRKVRERPRDEL